MRPSSAPEVGGGVEEAMHVLFCICVDICVFLCGVCVSSTPVSVCVCLRRSDLGAALMHKYPYTADTCGYSPSSSITHTVVCVILMYPKYPVSAILPHIKYPLVSWYPWHSWGRTHTNRVIHRNRMAHIGDLTSCITDLHNVLKATQLRIVDGHAVI